jgi:hypothetical protein
MIIFPNLDWICMAKKSNIKEPFSYSPSDTDVRAMTGVPAGDYYGTGVKNPMGRVRDGTVGTNPVSPAALSKPPKSLV